MEDPTMKETERREGIGLPFRPVAPEHTVRASNIRIVSGFCSRFLVLVSSPWAMLAPEIPEPMITVSTVDGSEDVVLCVARCEGGSCQ
jgi:hypothetical protein